MDKTIQIFKCGTSVKTKGLECTIIACEIRFNNHTYQLSYFYNGEYKTMWLSECEFSIEENNNQTIGFKN